MTIAQPQSYMCASEQFSSTTLFNCFVQTTLDGCRRHSISRNLAYYTPNCSVCCTQRIFETYATVLNIPCSKLNYGHRLNNFKPSTLKYIISTPYVSLNYNVTTQLDDITHLVYYLCMKLILLKHISGPILPTDI